MTKNLCTDIRGAGHFVQFFMLDNTQYISLNRIKALRHYSVKKFEGQKFKRVKKLKRDTKSVPY